MKGKFLLKIKAVWANQKAFVPNSLRRWKCGGNWWSTIISYLSFQDLEEAFLIKGISWSPYDEKSPHVQRLLKDRIHHGFHQVFPLIRLPNVTINTGFISQETKYKLDPKERFLTGSCENISMDRYIWRKLTLEMAVMWGKLCSISKFRMSHFGFGMLMLMIKIFIYEWEA